MQHSSDPGLRLVADAFRELQVDDEWTVEEDRGFSWWGHRLRQRIWAEAPFTDEDGTVVSCVHAQTDLLREAEFTPQSLGQISLMNMKSALSAYVWEEGTGQVSLHAKVYAHAGNLGWIQLLFRLAAATQVGRAHEASLAGFDERLAGQIDASEHPESGPRSEPDDMLSLIRSVRELGDASGHEFELGELVRLSGTDDDMAVMSSVGEQGLTAEFPCLSAHSAAAAMTDRVMGQGSGEPIGTALMQLSLEEAHPALGSGCFMKLELPDSAFSGLDINTADGLAFASVFANAMNKDEIQELTRAPMLGAWCVGPRGLAHVSFYPRLVARRGLLTNLYMAYGMRALWIGNQLRRSQQA